MSTSEVKSSIIQKITNLSDFDLLNQISRLLQLKEVENEVYRLTPQEKNAIDVGSRPYGQSAFEAKPAGVISASIGIMGGFGANHHLRQSLVFLDMPTMAQPEVYLGDVAKLFADEGHLINESTGELLKKFTSSFSDWVTKNSHFKSANNFEQVVQT